MKEAFDKIRKRMREELTLYEKAIQIVSEVEAEYNKKFEPAVDCIEYSVDGFNLYLKEQYRKGYEDAKAEYGNGWIPCSDRLPEESGYYLVTYHDWSDGNFLPKYDDTYVRRLHYQISEHFVGWNYPKNVDDRAENDCHKEVIAWQPLPAPYQKGE